ncbi:MAG: UDP-2,4-diacetamido-2,4,6-trideoxy-beta-L-altropyranose hydrolase [Clostridia bacterium]|nr:UDP-2,4-diacetamido-2,4,6-trideoxy-beta-L-altropyranose hydrolase [Clostridia bacterium]
MKVLIFTEGGNQLGLGHISRCSSLYDELASRGIEVEFIINGLPHEIDINNYKNVKIFNWLSADFLYQHIKKTDYCIVDSYLAGEDFYQVISAKARKCLFIDDFARIKYPKGIIANPSLSTENVKYPIRDENCYLLGSQYIIIRNPFINVKRATVNTKVKEVLITLGGSDLRNITPAILNQLCSSYPELIFHVVIGKANNNLRGINKNKLQNIYVYHNVNAAEMRNIMLKSDLAITAAGQTIYELLATQTPFIPIKVAENQSNNIAGLKELSLVETVLEHDDVLLTVKVEREFEKLMDVAIRNQLVCKYKKIVDGLGTNRIINFLCRSN